MTKKKKWLLIAIGGIILIVFIILALVKNQEKLIPVTIEAAEKGKIISIVTANGKVEAKTNVNISADVMGKIVDLPVIEGQQVAKGQLLVEIDQTQSLSDVDQMKALLASAQVDQDQARINFDRQRQLYDRKLISQAEYDLSKNVLDRSLQLVKQYKANLDRAISQLDKCTIKAPIAGTITQLTSKLGENVLIGTMNNPGTVMMVISDLSEIVVKASVDETDIAALALAQKVEISLDAFPDTTFKGQVTEIGNAAKSSILGGQDQVTNFEVTILITDQVPGIKPGMNASVDITTSTRDDVVKIPIQAVVMRAPGDTLQNSFKKTPQSDPDDKDMPPLSDKAKKDEYKDEMDGVYLVEKNSVRFIPIRTGISDQQYIEVISGLESGQKIVTGSYKTLRTLKNSDKVKPRERKFVEGKD